MRQHWSEVQIIGVDKQVGGELVVGSELEVRASVRLGQLNPLDVGVELYGGVLDADQEITAGWATPMQHVGVQIGVSQFVARVRFQASGLRGYTLRVLPRHEDLGTCFVPGLVVWGS